MPEPLPDIQIVTLAPDEWPLYKQIRLESLLTDPQAFGSRYDETLQRPDSFWQGRLAEAQARKTGWLLFAKEDGRIIGMIGAVAGEDSPVVEIISVYVSATARGRGAASALMTAILAEVGRRGTFRKAVLTVNAAQAAALALYRRFGFQLVAEMPSVAGDGQPYTRYVMEKILPG